MDIFKYWHALLCTAILLSVGCAPNMQVARIDIQKVKTAPIITPGAQHPVDQTLNDYIQNHETTVLYWWSNTCPCVRRYQERIEELALEYQNRDIGFIAVASNSDESINNVMEAAKERNLKLPVAFDTLGTWATSLRVKRTPTVLLIRRSGQILFRGWIDNERNIGEPGRIPYLENAISANLKGEKVANISPVRGCKITRSLLSTDSDCGCTELTPPGGS